MRVDLLPEHYVAESLAETFERLDVRGSKVLLPRAQEARDFLPARLAELGADVDAVAAYRTVLPDSSRELAARTWIDDVAPDWVSVTSSSTVRNLARLVPVEDLRRSQLASIGPVTSATARELGLRVAVEATRFTTEGLAQAIRASSASPPPAAG